MDGAINGREGRREGHRQERRAASWENDGGTARQQQAWRRTSAVADTSRFHRRHHLSRDKGEESEAGWAGSTY
uniref:Uncharacterized protein n=1 Tax=Oryza sativa subsp. japonica TaxID=39947 RepID=Q6YYR0_ORYSJ|nr:hypothetical protein [Oryza sativa Japonica Group]